MLQVQIGDEAALVRAGRVRHVISLSASRGIAPLIASVLPIAVEAGTDFELTITGSNIADDDAQLHCRQSGVHRDLWRLLTAAAASTCIDSVTPGSWCVETESNSTAQPKFVAAS